MADIRRVDVDKKESNVDKKKSDVNKKKADVKFIVGMVILVSFLRSFDRAVAAWLVPMLPISRITSSS